MHGYFLYSFYSEQKLFSVQGTHLTLVLIIPMLQIRTLRIRRVK